MGSVMYKCRGTRTAGITASWSVEVMGMEVDKMSRLVTVLFAACKMRGNSPSGNKASSEEQEEVQGASMRYTNALSGRCCVV